MIYEINTYQYKRNHELIPKIVDDRDSKLFPGQETGRQPSLHLLVTFVLSSSERKDHVDWFAKQLSKPILTQEPRDQRRCQRGQRRRNDLTDANEKKSDAEGSERQW